MEARYDQITVESVLARTKAQLRLQNTSDYDTYLSMVIFEGLGQLGTTSQLVKKQCGISITDNIAELPKDFVRLIAIRATVENNTNDPILNEINQCQYILYADRNFLKSCGCDENGWWNTFQINNGKIFFATPSATIVNGEMAYYGLNTDAEGRHLIFSRYERGLSNYASWQFGLMYPELINPNSVFTYQQTWIAQKSKLRAIDVRYNFDNDKREIQNILNGLVVSRTLNWTNG